MSSNNACNFNEGTTGQILTSNGTGSAPTFQDDTKYLLTDGTRALAGALNMGSHALTNVNIDSGSVDGATIGANNQSTGVFTTLDVDTDGTFTPTIGATGTNPDSITYSKQIGKHIKIGSFVFFQIVLRPATLTLGSASGYLEISGLPYTSSDDNFMPCTVEIDGVNVRSDTLYVLGRIQQNDTKIRLVEVLDDADADAVAITDLSVNDWIVLSGHYTV